jgi:uncharacterized phage-associated protein
VEVGRMVNRAEFVRFRVSHEKCIQGIHWLAKHQPGITQYYIGRVFFFADRDHLLDWGRPISGDRYVAMEHGPVPSLIYDLIKDTSGEPDELVDELSSRVEIVARGNKRHVYPKAGRAEFPELSKTDREYLLRALHKYAKMSFDQLKQLSHEVPAYNEAWALPGLNNEMNVRLWFGNDGNGKIALEQLKEKSFVVKRDQAGHRAA